MEVIKGNQQGNSPFTLAELKDHLRINGSDEDGLLALYLSAARDMLELQTGFVCQLAQFAFFLHQWPTNGIVFLPRTPVRNVLSVQVHDENGTVTTLAGWRLQGRRIYLPSPQSCRLLVVNFEAGDEVPPSVRVAVLSLASHLYANREAYTPDSLAPLPMGLEVILGQIRASYGVGGQQ
jgi:uncharacterized phiE125 gp8 family phage protein